MAHISAGYLLGDNFEVISTGRYTISGLANTKVNITGSIIDGNRGKFKVLGVREYTYSRTSTSISVSLGTKATGSPAINYVNIMSSQAIAAPGALATYWNDLESFNSNDGEAIGSGENLIIQHNLGAALTASLRLEIYGMYFGEHENWSGG